MPVLNTASLLPWATQGVLSVGEILCELQSPTGTPLDSRMLARSMLLRLESFGFAVKSGWEVEFYMLDAATKKPVFSGRDCNTSLVMAKQEEFLYSMIRMLNNEGIDITSLYVEHEAGQFELNTHPINGIEGADVTFKCKQAIKEICLANGRLATFMTLPAKDYLGGGALHYNMSLWGEIEKNMFYDANKDDNLSDVALWWIGGLLRHTNALTALCCPTVNCYRRLHKDRTAGLVGWEIENRSRFVVRMKNLNTSPYIEWRLPSSASNPYLVLAGVVAAGLDGITNKIKPPSRLDDSLGKIPATLELALDALEKDEVLCEILDRHFIKSFIYAKRDIELSEMKGCGPPNEDEEAYEREREEYFEFI